MGTLFERLRDAPPSGRRRALIIDSDAYARAVIRQGQPIPWDDLAALAGFAGQVQALLDPDAGWVDVGALQAAHLAGRPDLVAAMGERTRSGYALRTLLGDAEATAAVAATLELVAQRTRRVLVLDCPSPARWAAIAAAVAGVPVDEVDEDAADTASMYVAEWLGKLGGVPIALVVFEAAGEAGGAAIPPETLGAYTAIANVAQHLDWAIAMRGADAVETAGASRIGVVPADYWSGGDADVDGDVLLAEVPADAVPERVLDQLARLG